MTEKISDMFNDKFNKEKIHDSVIRKIKIRKYKIIGIMCALFCFGYISLISLNNNTILKCDEININLKTNDSSILVNTILLDVGQIFTEIDSANIYQLVDKLDIYNDFENIEILKQKNFELYKILNLKETELVRYNFDDKLVAIAFSLNYNFNELSNIRSSIINNNKVDIIKDNEIYYIYFQYNGINFYIETYNLNENDMLSLIKDIIRK